MRYFQKLIGEKCYLSPINIDDAKHYSQWLNDFSIAKNLMIFDQSLSEKNERDFLSNCENQRNYFFAIIDKKSDKLIGNTGLNKVNLIDRKADIGIFIGDKDFHHKGYGSEAMNLTLDFAFNYLNLNNIFLEVYEFNENAIKLYEKIGFKKIGIYRQAKLINRKFFDVILMDMLAEEFKSPFIGKYFE